MKRFVLPIADRAGAAGRPSVSDVRKRLGGRAQTETAGDIVALEGGDEIEAVGVVVFAAGGEVHVLTGGGVVRRAPRERTRPVETAPESLLPVAADARAFAELQEGDRVRFEGGAEGTLVEKCRYGALVARESGSIVGVGFRAVARAGVDA